MGLMIDKPAKTLIERFAQKQPGGHFACPRCGKMTTDAESATHTHWLLHLRHLRNG